MSLRRRLSLTVLAITVPVVLAVWLVYRDFQRTALAQRLREYAVVRMENGGRARCEDDPMFFRDVEPPERRPGPPPGPGGRRGGPGGPPPHDAPDRPEGGRRDGPPHGPREREPFGGPGGLPPRSPETRTELWAYDDAFLSANRSAPSLPESMVRQLKGGEDVAVEPLTVGERSGHVALVRMPWTGSKCAFVLVRRLSLHPPELEKTLLAAAGLASLVVLVAMLFAAGPLVRRIRRLTADVRSAAAERYRAGVVVQGQDEIAALAQAFNDAGATLRDHVETIEQRERTLRDFVANTTHDVMLPLTVLQGHLAALREQPGVAQDLVVAAMEESHYMASLVHNLSAAARLEAGAPEPERHPILLNELVERVAGRHQPIARPRGITVEFAVPEAPLRMLGDLTLVEQAVSNVVHNAVRYNKAGGHVAIVLEERAGRRFGLRVLDDGPGVPEDQLARLTERSFRTEQARTRAPDGMGLGLHIARVVADRHGFAMVLRRSEFGGLEVEFEGPLAAS